MKATELKEKQKALHDKMDKRAAELGFTNEIAPIYDGVKDVDGYLDSKLKILWVMKEPYEHRTE